MNFQSYPIFSSPLTLATSPNIPSLRQVGVILEDIKAKGYRRVKVRVDPHISRKSLGIREEIWKNILLKIFSVKEILLSFIYYLFPPL